MDPSTKSRRDPAPEVPSDWEPDPEDFEDELPPELAGAEEEEAAPRTAAVKPSATVPSPKVEYALGHWSHLINGLQTSSLDFYATLEEAITRRRIPRVRMRRVAFAEGGVLDARREYLRIERGDLRFDVCAAAFGTGFFFSWWLAGRPRLWWLVVVLICVGLLIPTWAIQDRSFGFGPKIGISVGLVFIALIGAPLVHKLLNRITYYYADRVLMFRGAVHQAVTETIDGILTTKGMRALSEKEKKPIMRKFLRP